MKNKIKYIPPELVDIIASFCDYKKHHMKIFLPVLQDIKQTAPKYSSITKNTISEPYLAYHCWRNGWSYNKYHDIDHESMYDD